MISYRSDENCDVSPQDNNIVKFVYLNEIILLWIISKVLSIPRNIRNFSY